MELTFAVLGQFMVRDPSDLAKANHSKELVHIACGYTVCDVGHGDSFAVLVRTVLKHRCTDHCTKCGAYAPNRENGCCTACAKALRLVSC